MYKSDIPFFAKLLLYSALIISCKNSAVQDDVRKIYQDNPVTIMWEENSNKGEIESYEADVSVYSSSNRKANGFELVNKYRLFLKTINGEQYSRIDFNPEYNTGLCRTIISNNELSLVVDGKTNQVQYRIKNDTNQNLKRLPFLSGNSGLTKLNLDFIKSECSRLSLDMQESESSKLLINIPSDYFLDKNNDTRLSTKIYFDTIDETLEKIETVTIEEDGAFVTTTVYPVYEDSDGELVKVGSVTEIDVKYEVMSQENFDEYYDSVNDIPEITKAELEKMQGGGSITKIDNLAFGNPADLSYIETVAEVYQDVKINSVPDEAFRILLDAVGE